MEKNERSPTTDEALGMKWWNALTEAQRAHWMARAGNTGVVADAWSAFRKQTANRKGAAK